MCEWSHIKSASLVVYTQKTLGGFFSVYFQKKHLLVPLSLVWADLCSVSVACILGLSELPFCMLVTTEHSAKESSEQS